MDQSNGPAAEKVEDEISKMTQPILYVLQRLHQLIIAKLFSIIIKD
jgi:hypothetical protein